MKPVDLMKQLVHYRTYAKTLDNGLKETREQTINRCRDMHIGKFPDLKEAITGAFEQVHLGRVVPSMRTLQFGGEPVIKTNARAYNCAFAALTSWRDFSDLFYLLMCGTGTGYSVQKHHIERLPSITYDKGVGNIFIVEDSKEGWCDALYKILTEPCTELDVHLVRRKGSPLSSGGTASGPEALLKTIAEIKAILRRADGRKLRPIECHDIMCHIANGVVVGGVRRAALACIFDVADTEMLTCKHGLWYETNPQRARANNSAVILRSDPSCEKQIRNVMQAMFDSNAGEPGVFLSNNKNLGTNPCVTGDTKILTKEGLQEISSLVGKETSIWNGFEWSKVVPKITGHNQEILEVKFSDGRTLKCTPYHNFHIQKSYKRGDYIVKQANELSIGDKLIKCEYPVIQTGKKANIHMYTQGFYSADGVKDRNLIWLYEPKFMLEEHLNLKRVSGEYETFSGIKRKGLYPVDTMLPKDFVPLEYNIEARLAWLAGLFDGDGCELKEGGIQLASTDINFLENVQALLTTCGVNSKIVSGAKAGKRPLPDQKGGIKLYECQETKRLCLGATQAQNLVNLGMKCIRLQFNKLPNRDASRFTTVASVKKIGKADTVYCFNEPKRHLGVFDGVITGQCYEISLKDGQLCNLSEINVAACDNKEDFIKAAKAATLIGTLQAAYTDFTYLQPKWKMNCEEEALLGISLTGQAQKWLELTSWLTPEVSKLIKDLNKKIANELGIKSSARITTTKPSGSTSTWLGTTSGIHAAHSEYYIRRIRVDVGDPVASVLKKSKFVEVDSFNKENLVVSIPIAAPDAITRKEETAIELMERAKFIYEKWIACGHNSGDNTHNVSLTVSYKPEEKDDIVDWMVENKDNWAGIAFLPYDGGSYTQAPFEEITEDVYRLLEGMFDIEDLSQVDYTGTIDERLGELACQGGACEII